jgi:FemAB-related protein (PEP-CTERM system-associated)
MSDSIAIHEHELPAEWDDYVRGHPQGTWYQQSRWKRLIEDTFGHRSFYLSAEREGKLLGVLPFSLVSSWTFGRILVSGAYGCYGGTCADDTPTARALLSRASSLAHDLRVDYLELRCIEPLDDPDLKVKTFKQTFWLDLADDPEVMWSSFRSEIRNRTRKAAKAGCVAQVGGQEFLDEFYGVFCRRMRELGTPPYGRRLFENLVRIYGEDARIVTVHRAGKPIGAGIMVFDGCGVEVPWISSLGSEFQAYPNNAMYQEAIRYAIGRGCKRFDFGTSNAGSGNAQFKQRWGARTVQLHWQYLLVKQRELPDLSPHNPKLSLAVRAWRRLPLWATKVVGPRIMRRIP